MEGTEGEEDGVAEGKRVVGPPEGSVDRTNDGAEDGIPLGESDAAFDGGSDGANDGVFDEASDGAEDGVPP